MIRRPHKGKQMQKLQPNFEGPFIVEEVSPNGVLTIFPFPKGKSRRIHINNAVLMPGLLPLSPELEACVDKERTKKAEKPILLDDDQIWPETPSVDRARTEHTYENETGENPYETIRPRERAESSSSSSSSDSHSSDIGTRPIPPSPPIARQTRSRTGPLPNAVLQNFPQERRQNPLTVLRNIFSPRR